MIPLFEQFPALLEKIPFVSMGHYPTPVLRANKLDSDGRSSGIIVKQDGLTGDPYGGNKLRKLEFLLGDALAKGKTDIVTFGGAGSNHALATAIYAQRLGLKAHSFLIAQPNSKSLQNNLLRSLSTDVTLRHFETIPGLASGTILKLISHVVRGKGLPCVIPPGGSSALGLLGYVNAAFELKAQMDAGEIEPPDVIYAAAGTLGTVAGLALGFQILKLKTKICAIAVTDTDFSSMRKAKTLFEKTNNLLRQVDKNIPKCNFEDCALEIRRDFFSGEYGRYTQRGMAAVRHMKDTTGLKIEGCYTGNCVAALLEDLQLGLLDNKQVLFWNTYDGHSQSPTPDTLDYHQLPTPFYQYFENNVQELELN